MFCISKVLKPSRNSGDGVVTAGEQTVTNTGQNPRSEEEVEIAREANFLMSQEHSPAGALGLGGSQSALSRIIHAKPRSKKLHLEPNIASRHTGESQQCQANESSGVGDIYIFYIYIFSLL